MPGLGQPGFDTPRFIYSKQLAIKHVGELDGYGIGHFVAHGNGRWHACLHQVGSDATETTRRFLYLTTHATVQNHQVWSSPIKEGCEGFCIGPEGAVTTRIIQTDIE